LQLDQGCKILTENHILLAGKTVTQEEKIHMWPINWAVDKLFDLTKSDIDKIVKELQLISKKPTMVRDLHKLMANYSNFQNHQQQHTILTCIILVVAIGVCCILVQSKQQESC
jgi:hypothetical protein